MSEHRQIDWETTFKQLEILEQDKKTFNMPDPLLTRILDSQSDRLGNAAMFLGKRWNGMFSRAHVLLIARAYLLAKQGQPSNGT